MNILHRRQGQMDYGQIYFFTQTVKEHKHLLADDDLKRIIIESLQFLSNANLITIFLVVGVLTD